MKRSICKLACVTMMLAASSYEAGAAASAPTTKASVAASVAPPSYTPPAADSIPDDGFGKTVRLGEQIFLHTRENAGKYVGNSLNCVSCHLDAGRKPNSSPMGAAYLMYPAYRSKNGHVNTFAERLQGCFHFSMNGKPPPLGDPALVALETYAYWLAKGAPVGQKIPGQGYPTVAKPPLPADFARGRQVYEQRCALCHNAAGEGQSSAGKTVFPPLWGPKSFNWGAGMHDVKNAAGFIKANMPLGLGGTLSDQDAWDVATFMDSQERPQDPRFKGSVEETRKKFHDSPTSMYGLTVNGHVLGGKK
ncbi:MAG: c-type cytochrome [Burkholderiaceae bacterium]